MDTASASPVPSRSVLLVTGILAVVFSVLVILPSILQRLDTTYPFQGISILGPDAEVYYAARVREIYDGFPGVGNAFYSAPKDLPYVQPPLPEHTIAVLGELLGLSAIHAFLLAKILLAMASMVAMALLVYVITHRPWISVFSAFISLTAGALLAAPWDAQSFVTGENFSYEFLRFSRLLHPQWTTTVFLFALVCIAQWMSTHRRRYLFVASLLTTALVYAYVYGWSYLFAIMGLLFLHALWKRDLRRTADLVGFFALTLFLSTPYAMHLYILMQHEWYADTAMRSGLVLRHGPLILGVWAASFVGLGLGSRRLWPAVWPLLPVTALAGVIALNQQLFTGHFVVPHHYNWYYIQPIASTFAVALALSLLSAKRVHVLLRTFCAVLLVAASTLVAVIQQHGAYQGVRSVWGRLQSAAPVVRYVEANLRPGQVVYTQDPNLANILPVLTSADVYFAGNANLSLTSIDRARYTYFFDLWLQGVSPDQAAREFPTIRRWMLSSRLYAIYYRELSHDFAKIPENAVQENIALYRAFVRLPLKQKLTTYPLSAVITAPGDPRTPQWDQFLACTREVYAEQGYAVRLLIQSGFPNSCI